MTSSNSESGVVINAVPQRIGTPLSPGATKVMLLGAASSARKWSSRCSAWVSR